MNPQHVLLVKHSFHAASAQRERLAGIFLAELFARDPSLWRLFRSDPALRVAHLHEGLAAIVDSIDRLYPIVPVLEWIAGQGARRRIGEPQLAAIGEALLAAFDELLGGAFTPAHRQAWAAASRSVVDVMLAALDAEPLAA
ncbi:MAG: hypothetical protein ACXWUX_13910 [Allosphingosinicella sp.]